MSPDNDPNETRPAFIDVALPLPMRRTFTYGVPKDFPDQISPGSRVTVPFGNRKITGFAVRSFTEIDRDLGLDPAKVKGACELLEAEPLVTPEILGLTKWAAEY